MSTLYYIIVKDMHSPEQRIFGYAFTCRENAEYYAGEINQHYLTKNAIVAEVEVALVNCFAYYVQRDSGRAGGGFLTPMHELLQYSRIYPCVEDAKRDELWQGSLDFFKKHPDEKKHETESMIATDNLGEPFRWRDHDGFVTTIERIQVVTDAEKWDRDQELSSYIWTIW